MHIMSTMTDANWNKWQLITSRTMVGWSAMWDSARIWGEWLCPTMSGWRPLHRDFPGHCCCYSWGYQMCVLAYMQTAHHIFYHIPILYMCVHARLHANRACACVCACVCVCVLWIDACTCVCVWMHVWMDIRSVCVCKCMCIHMHLLTPHANA